uniref:3-hydroxyisobutyryl-CoA hydrolase n=1 Tax=Chlamydomonas leiostraca TaxID=1034604 RepID=A0A7S0REX9_9CHLO|mmetsp:Transcript_21176/g.53835  ORF Transcript_21176/g.53835 Transcript_21176/m.53835 type:complete len:436 (+) Transcript_21176:76-1383(+)
MTKEVLFHVKDGIGTITLNRPAALNSLTYGMVCALADIMASACAPGSGVQCIVIKSCTSKAFCAGGDVKAVVAQAADRQAGRAADFFAREYALNAAIAACPLPYVSLLDGVVMGGGAGLSVHGHFRVATDRTVFAMPECAIGLFPDVGATAFLSRLPGAAGEYLGTTGARLTGAAMRESGLATHLVHHSRLTQLEADLAALGAQGRAGDLGAVAALLGRHQDVHDPLPDGGWRALQPLVSAHFSRPTMSDIRASLQRACAGPASSSSSSSNHSAISVQQLVSQGDALVVSLPASLGPQLTEGVLELGDMDDPLNAWCWGDRGEIFQYTLAGTHTTRSGYSALIPRADLEALLQQNTTKKGHAAGAAPSWQAFVKALAQPDAATGGAGTGSDTIRPFLFAGRIVESDLASVYVLKSGSDVTGVMVSSVAAGGGESD